MSEEEYRIIKAALDLMLDYSVIDEEEYNLAITKTADRYDGDL